jgi:SAM-dependent methyltransferase
MFKHYFWARQPAIDAALLKHFAGFVGAGKLVVDVGAGYDPWPHATEFIDRHSWPQLTNKLHRKIDFEVDPLPYPDKSVDFLYCRHTIEDMHNPTLLLREINRVAKAGYVETPSPLAEFCRGTGCEGGDRGYRHHRWIGWSNSGCFCLLPKYPVIEASIVSQEFEARIIRDLSTTPALWNSYFPWDGQLNFRTLEHLRDFDLVSQYGEMINNGIIASVKSTAAFLRDFDLENATFYGIPAEQSKQP